MSATFFNMRRRLAAEAAKKNAEKSKEEPTPKTKKEKVKKDEQ